MQATEKRSLKCKLTDAELIERGREQAETYKNKCRLEKLKADEASVYKGKIDAEAQRLDKLAEICKSGFEPREVSCTWVPDYKLGRKALIRDDTGEVVEELVLTSEERQGRLLS